MIIFMFYDIFKTDPVKTFYVPFEFKARFSISQHQLRALSCHNGKIKIIIKGY